MLSEIRILVFCCYFYKTETLAIRLVKMYFKSTSELTKCFHLCHPAWSSNLGMNEVRHLPRSDLQPG